MISYTNHSRIFILLWFALSILLCLPSGSICMADAIHDAANAGNLAEMRRLIDADPKVVNAQLPTGATALLWACIRGQVEVARLLVERGADVDIPQGDGWSPLHAAVTDGNDAAHVELTRLLLDHKAKIGITNVNGLTPLHVAAQKGNTSTMQLLLDRGADIHVKDKKGLTPLALALQEGQPASVELLLAGQRVDLHVKDLPLADTLKQLFALVDLSCTFDTELRGNVTVDLVKIPFLSALKTILRTEGNARPLTYRIQPGGFHIAVAEPAGVLYPRNAPNTTDPLSPISSSLRPTPTDRFPASPCRSGTTTISIRLITSRTSVRGADRGA